MRGLFTTALVLGSASAFQSVSKPLRRWVTPTTPAPLVLASTSAPTEETAPPCDAPDADKVAVTGATLRGLRLTNAAGEEQTLGEAMGEGGSSVVCFLRHLG